MEMDRNTRVSPSSIGINFDFHDTSFVIFWDDLRIHVISTDNCIRTSLSFLYHHRLLAMSHCTCGYFLVFRVVCLRILNFVLTTILVFAWMNKVPKVMYKGPAIIRAASGLEINRMVCINKYNVFFNFPPRFFEFYHQFFHLFD